MLPLSHAEPIFAGIDRAVEAASSALRQPVEAESLADAFAEFVGVSARLEASYRDLQAEVAQLNRELADRNAALRRSLDENGSMRRALDQIVASMPCGVIVLDAEESVTLMNPEAGRLLGVAAYTGQTLAEIGDIIGIPLARLSRLGGDPEFCLGQGEQARWTEMRVRRISAPGCADTGQTILVLRDISQQRAAETQREGARRAHALAEIAAMLAHEIRNPLASLELFSSLLADDAAQPGRHPGTAAWVAHLRAGIRSLAATVNNVLSFHGHAAMPMGPLPLAETVRDAVAFAAPVVAETGVELRFAAESSAPAVHGNRDAIAQIVLNLILNAVRHTPAGGLIMVSVRAEDPDSAVVEVRDTGCGIPKEQIPQLFRAGFSGSGATSGLGLAVCAQLARQHAGRITVDSSHGEGAAFRMELPIL